MRKKDKNLIVQCYDRQLELLLRCQLHSVDVKILIWL